MLTLYDNPFSPFARKVRMVLQIKGAPYQSIDALALQGIQSERAVRGSFQTVAPERRGGDTADDARKLGGGPAGDQCQTPAGCDQAAQGSQRFSRNTSVLGPGGDWRQSAVDVEHQGSR